MDREFESFSAEKRQIRYEEPPELIFFDTDEDIEEAEFIRVDDLFSGETAAGSRLSGRLSFTLFPQKFGEIIDSRLSRLIRRMLILSAFRMQRPAVLVRVRPGFVQWQMDLDDSDEPELIAREFRADLELQLRGLKKMQPEERYWSLNCFVCPADKTLSDDTINRMAAVYQTADD